jgi:hypothetical protein
MQPCRKTNITLYNYRYEKNNKSTWVPHVFTVIKKENWHYKSSSFGGEELYEAETCSGRRERK